MFFRKYIVIEELSFYKPFEKMDNLLSDGIKNIEEFFLFTKLCDSLFSNYFQVEIRTPVYMDLKSVEKYFHKITNFMGQYYSTLSLYKEDFKNLYSVINNLNQHKYQVYINERPLNAYTVAFREDMKHCGFENEEIFKKKVVKKSYKFVSSVIKKIESYLKFNAGKDLMNYVKILEQALEKMEKIVLKEREAQQSRITALETEIDTLLKAHIEEKKALIKALDEKFNKYASTLEEKTETLNAMQNLQLERIEGLYTQSMERQKAQHKEFMNDVLGLIGKLDE